MERLPRMPEPSYRDHVFSEVCVNKGFNLCSTGRVAGIEQWDPSKLISYTLTATPKAGGEQIKDDGKSVFIVRRQEDNSWKIARLIDNSRRVQT